MSNRRDGSERCLPRMLGAPLRRGLPHGHFAVHHIVRNDLFGHYDYFETPGGGIDQGENPEQAVVRECREELGYEVRILAEIGYVDDFYNLIGRENHQHYFLCLREGDYLGKHFVSSGDNMHFIPETLIF